MVDELSTCELDVTCHPDGTMTCEAEFLADGATLRIAEHGQGAACKKATLRLYRTYDQVVHIPVMGAAGG